MPVGCDINATFNPSQGLVIMCCSEDSSVGGVIQFKLAEIGLNPIGAFGLDSDQGYGISPNPGPTADNSLTGDTLSMIASNATISGSGDTLYFIFWGTPLI